MLGIRTLLIQFVAIYSLYGNHHSIRSAASDFAPLFVASPTQNVFEPQNINELQEVVRKAHLLGKKIAIKGAGASMGGQALPPSSADYQISLAKINHLVDLNIEKKEVTVQAGMTWKRLQEHIAPHGLAIKSMQSYHDFAIGGAISVNAHGQALQYAPLRETVISCVLLQPNGNLVTLSKNENPQLFNAVIGGYGLFGIIVQATLSLTDDVILDRKAVTIDSSDLADYFTQQIQHNPNIAFYSARFSIAPSELLTRAVVITYETTNEHSPKLFELHARKEDTLANIALRIITKSPFAKALRFKLEQMYLSMPQRISRNNFTYISITNLPAPTAESEYILQEYFVPYAQLNTFLDGLRKTASDYKINLCNVTARHVHQDTESMLSYAPTDCCALVLYINISKNPASYEKESYGKNAGKTVT